MPELIRLQIDLVQTSGKEQAAARSANGRERKLYVALLAIASLNVFLICGALSFLWLVFRD
ncbi:MAG TPA: hypothetical protein VH601_22935 [Bryobacteraceae bacterium]